MDKGFFKSENLNIYYESTGEGKPIILVHGWGSSLRGNWVEPGWVEALSYIRRVVALDVRGHGESDKPHMKSLYSYKRMGIDVLNLMDHLDLTSADYFGYSMGSCMGASLFAQAGSRFDSMILGGFGAETEASLALLPSIVKGLREKPSKEHDDPVSIGYRRFVESDPRNDPEALALSALQMWPEGFPLQLMDSDLKQIRSPVLVLNGSEDHPYVETVKSAVDQLPNAKLIEIPGCDHLTTILDPQSKKVVLDFLTNGLNSAAC